MCGDSRHDLNYPEIPNSWSNKEKANMLLIIAFAIYDGGIDVAVPTFLLGLVVWYGVLFESGLADADDILGI